MRLILGCGFLGQRVAKKWLKQGHQVAALTRNPQRAVQLRNAGLQPIVGAVNDPDSLQELPDCELLFWAVGFDRTKSLDKRTVYVDGLRNALQAVRGRCDKVIYTSSASVYGQSNGEWVDEESDCSPQTEGGKICLDAEDVLRDFVDESNIRSSILRLTGIYGPGRFFRSLDAIQNGTPIAGNPDAWLNLIHVDDAATVVDACAEHPSASDKYVVTDDLPVTRRDYYLALAEYANGPEPTFDATATSRGRSPESLNKRCKNDRMRSELKVHLAYPNYREGLEDALGS